MRFVIDAVYLLLSLFLWPRWLRKLWIDAGFRGSIMSRLLGRAPQIPGNSEVVWFHGSSIGEILLLKRIVEQYCAARPNVQVVISAYESDGIRAARVNFPDAVVVWLPFDLSWSVRRFVETLKPRLVVLSELELWPNLLLAAARRAVPVAVVSCRMNDKDVKFFRRIRFLHRRPLAAVQWWGVQTETDAERIAQLLGGQRNNIAVTGSLKFDATRQEPSSERTEHLRRLLGFQQSDRILVAGSTHAPEEEILLNAFDELSNEFPDLRLAIAPRDADRFLDVAKMLNRRKVVFIQRSRVADSTKHAGVVTLIDSIGELPRFWRIADVAFVGGTLATDAGGHNVIEPAACAKPVCFGPHCRNFSEVATALVEAQAACVVTSTADIVSVVGLWLRNPNLAQSAGARGSKYVESQQGASRRSLSALLALDVVQNAGLPDWKHFNL